MGRRAYEPKHKGFWLPFHAALTAMLDATFLLRAAAKRRAADLARQDPAAVQTETLLGLLRTARGTRIGQMHDFATIHSIATYQARVPLRRYEDLWRNWWQPVFPNLRGATWPADIPFIAESSGTTAGTSKCIPVSHAMIRANQRAAQHTLGFHVLNHPGARLLGGMNFMLGGSTALRELAPGIQAGDLSGIAAATMPPLARTRAFPPKDLALIADWDAKLGAVAKAALPLDIRSIAGTPSWLLMLFQRLSDLHPRKPSRLAEIFPHLELIVHGGTGFDPYRDMFAAWMEGGAIATREVYAASEGYIAAADANPQDGLRLMLDNGLFFEFVRPAELVSPKPVRHWIGSARKNQDYALIITSNAGLFSTIIGDVVRLVSLSPPRIVVSGRLDHELSVFGEHLIGAELDAAVAQAARACGGTVADYTATARLPKRHDPHGQHIFAVEFSNPAADPGAFAQEIDRTLMRMNDDYAAHRRRNAQLLAPEIIFVPPGRFEDWMRSRGKLGGQNKVPRVLTDALAFAELTRK